MSKNKKPNYSWNDSIANMDFDLGNNKKVENTKELDSLQSTLNSIENHDVSDMDLDNQLEMITRFANKLGLDKAENFIEEKRN